MNKLSESLTGKTEFRKIGGSWFVKISPDYANHIGLLKPSKVEDGTTKEAREQTEEGKHGKYLSIWNPEQQENEKKD